MSTPGSTTPPPQSETQHDGNATLIPDSEKKEEVVETFSEQTDDPPEHDYLSGSKLFCVLSGLTLAGFLMLVDASIVATVSTWPELGPWRGRPHSC